jgi:hypothetical protein
MKWILHAIPAAVALTFGLGALPLAAQVDEEYISPPELGASISIPKPDEREIDASRYPSPELTDTRPAIGSQLVDGRLPRALLDYSIVTQKSLQRLTFFERGLVVLHMKAGDANLRKRMILPEHALEEYLRMLSPEDAARIAREEIMMTALSDDRGVIRIYREDGSWAEVEFSNSRVLPAIVQQFRSVLDDLIRILAEDRGATNPLANYVPRLGDKLISEDMKLFEITAFAGKGEIIEFTGLQQPIRLYVAKDDIPSYFHAILGRNPN